MSTLDWFVANRDELLLGSAVAAVLVAIMFALRIIGRATLADSDDHVGWKSVIARVLAKTSIAFMIAAALYTVTTYAEPGSKFARPIYIFFTVAAGLQGAIWARELILGLIGRRAAEGGAEGSALSSAMAVIRVLISVSLFAIAIILILDNLGVNVTALVAGLGIGGIAIGLAAQGIFSDLFAALSILFDRPFKKGDTIRYDNSTGTVERIGLKTTRIRSLTGEQLIMANTKLLDREIHNMATAKARRMTVYFAVDSKTAIGKLEKVPDLVGAAVVTCAGCKLVRCGANGVGSGAISFELVYDDKSLDNNRTALNRASVILDLVRWLRADGIELVRASDIPPPLAPF